MPSRPLLLLLFASSVFAGEWRNGQAARAVIGQFSFTASDPSSNPIGLAIANRKLYVADSARRVSAYDLNNVTSSAGKGGDTNGCAVCGWTPINSVAQAVSPTSARFATSGRSVAIADTVNHRVLFWRDKSASTPDAVLGGAVNASSPDAWTTAEPVSVALDSQYLYVGDAAFHRVLIWKTASLSSGQAADAVLGQRDLNSYDAPVVGPATLNVPAALSSDGSNLFVADSLYHRILVFTPGDALLTSDSIVNSASLASGPLAPGTLITIRGERLASTTEAAEDDGTTPLPTMLAGAVVWVDGHPIPLLSVSPKEIRAQLPYTLTYASGATLSIRFNASDGSVRTTNAVALKLAAASPGIFAFANGPEPRPGVLLHSGGDDGESGGGHPVTSGDPARGGEVLVIWASGLGLTATPDNEQPVAGTPYGETAPAPVRSEVEAQVNDQSVEVVSATLPPRAVGIYEVRIVLPRDLPAQSAVSLTLRQDGVSSNTVTFPLGSTIHN